MKQGGSGSVTYWQEHLWLITCCQCLVNMAAHSISSDSASDISLELSVNDFSFDETDSEGDADVSGNERDLAYGNAPYRYEPYADDTEQTTEATDQTQDSEEDIARLQNVEWWVFYTL